GTTILFVTHDMASVERFCDRAMLLDNGRMVALDAPATIARQYRQLNFGQTVHQMSDGKAWSDARTESRAAAIVDAWFEDVSGERIASIEHREPCRVCMEVHFNDDFEDPIFGVTLRNE